MMPPTPIKTIELGTKDGFYAVTFHGTRVLTVLKLVSVGSKIMKAHYQRVDPSHHGYVVKLARLQL